MKLYFVNIIFFIIDVESADSDYNIVKQDGSFQFGYDNPDSYHYADGNRNNVVRGEFGGRNPKTGAIDTTVYTAGPRGYRPRGKNVFRNYDLNQNGPRPLGSPDDPYYDPYEDPSYQFGFKTRTYTRQENANRVGDVTGRYSYLDDIGERHNVEYIAGKNTGFHVKTPFPDSNPRAYGPLYFRGRGKPIPRGRTSIQRGLDGSYKFVSAGPDQRRTEVSDSTGHVRGSYTYLDDKGVQHAVHYIAGPETGYRVLKTVKGAHLPTIFPFQRPDIISPDFYDYGPFEGDLFDTAASGHPIKPGGKPAKPTPDLGNGIDLNKDEYDSLGGDKGTDYGNRKPPTSSNSPGSSRPGHESDVTGDEYEDDFGDLFGGGGGGGSSTSARPGLRPTTSRPSGKPNVTTYKPGNKPGDDDGSYKPEGDDGSYKPSDSDGSGRIPSKGDKSSSTTTVRPGGSTTSFSGYPSGKPSAGQGYNDDYDFNGAPGTGPSVFGSNRPGSGNGDGSIQTGFGENGRPCTNCVGTIVTNVGYKPFHVPPGTSVRAHVQSIDLYPYESRNDGHVFSREQLNEGSTQPPKNNEDQTADNNELDITDTTDSSIETTTKISD